MARQKKSAAGAAAKSPHAESAGSCCCTTARPAGREKSDCCRRKVRSEAEYHDLIVRLNRIEGQVGGIRKMVENDVYCIDILVQVAAVSSALHNFTRELLAQHIDTCVADDLRAGNEEKLDELLHYLPKFMK